MTLDEIVALERNLQGLILDWLQAVHILAFRMNTGAMMTERGGRKHVVHFGVPGMADILAFRRRRDGSSEPVWIECKAPGGKQSDLQKSFQRQVEDFGHRYVIARSLEDAKCAMGM